MGFFKPRDHPTHLEGKGQTRMHQIGSIEHSGLSSSIRAKAAMRQAKEELTGIRNPRASGGSNGNRERRRLWRRTAAILLFLGWKDASNHENNIGNGLKRLKTVW
ncbi:hypothetical protein CRG98_031614 [Punica granatum]|uniref:Uncharacterized protein n=1 Tax=Punica granatum TaxID=22663 RepID=A0A2I0IVH4_PUNGR|nr:hypothetical protein CRG98_031614 [Punica granatum]